MGMFTPSSGLGGRRTRRAAAAVLAVTVAAGVVVFAGPAPAGAGSLPTATRLVSRDDGGNTIKGPTREPAISDDGRFVAFVTNAAVEATDTNGKADVYLRDLWAGTTELISVTDAEQPIVGDSTAPSISDDGRFIAFLSTGSNLIPGDDKGFADVFVRDRWEQTTRWMNPSFAKTPLLTSSSEPRISGDGSTVVFTTAATTVVPNDTNNLVDVFAREVFGTDIERVSVAPDETQADGASSSASVSNDGRYVTFVCDCSLAGGVASDSNTYRRDRVSGTTVLVNVRNGGGVPDNGSGTSAMSGDGRWVAFASNATNIVTGDTNGQYDVFVRDMTSNAVIRASLTDGDAQSPLGATAKAEAISDDGKTVLFASIGQYTSATDAGSDFDVFARNTATGTTRRITTGPNEPDPADQSTSGMISGDGKVVAFFAQSRLTNESFDQIYTSGPVDIGPFVNTGSTINAQYVDFLGRSATPSEIAAWTDTFQRGTAQYPALVASLAANPTFSATRAPLIRLYWAFFLRRPDSSGLTYWLKKYRGGSSLTSIAQSFAKSSEFTNRYGNVSNQAYVQLVYLNIFRRSPDAGGLAFWTNKLNAGTITRGAVIVQFSESNEGKRRLAGPTNITLVSLGMLRTTPSATQWTALYEPISLGEPQSLAFAAHTLANTAQYQARYQ